MSETPFPNPQTTAFNPSAWNIEGLTEDEETYLDTHFVRFPNPQSGLTFPDAPTAPTLPNGTNTTQVATTGFVQNAITAFKAATNVWSALNTFNGGLSATSITRTGTLTITGTPLALSGTRLDTTMTPNYTYPIASGKIGEIISSTVATLAVTPSIVQDLTSLTLTAGVWLIQFDTYLSVALTSGNYVTLGINTTSATLTGARAQNTIYIQVGGTAPVSANSTAMSVSINASTTYYAVGISNQTGTYDWTNINFSATRIA
jgi:hypothetical protein